MSRKSLAAQCGVNSSTIHRWVKAGAVEKRELPGQFPLYRLKVLQGVARPVMGGAEVLRGVAPERGKVLQGVAPGRPEVLQGVAPGRGKVLQGVASNQRPERRQDERRQDERRGRIPGWSQSTREFLEGQQNSRGTSSPDPEPEISDDRDDGWVEYFWKPILITAALGVAAKTARFPVELVPGVLGKMVSDMGRGVGSLVGFTHKAKKKVEKKVQETRRGSARVLEVQENRLRARQDADPDSGVVLPAFLQKTVKAR